MDILSEKQLSEIEKIMDEHIGTVLHITTGQGKPSKELLKQLGLPENSADSVQSAYVLGKVMKMMENEDISKLTFDQLKRRVRNYTLSPSDKNALRYAQNNTGEHVTSLGDTMKRSVRQQINQQSQEMNLNSAHKKAIKDKTKQAVIKKQSQGKLSSELGHAIGDWKRDWRRVANTEIWDAKLHGEAMSIIEGDTIHSHTGGADAKVYRRPASDACTHCKRLHLEKDGITPKVFKLSELIANGTNKGLKTAQWQPVVGTVHPNCRCPLSVIPEGFGFDDKGKLVLLDEE